MSLHTTAIGESGPWAVFLHGLFGQGRNWTSIAKALLPEHRSLLVDLPHHGRSDWHDDVDYVAMADEVAAALPAEPVSLVGHSMGGKVAMLLALRHPEQVERLVVVDIGPSERDAEGAFSGYVAALRGVDLSGLERRVDASRAIRDAVPDDAVRAFLLQNLRHDPSAPAGEQWGWRMNLAVLGDRLDVLGGFPDPGDAHYDGPTLWVCGDRSDYVSDDDVATMHRLFPQVRRVRIKDAGHWVHAEQPEVFTGVLRRFLAPVQGR